MHYTAKKMEITFLVRTLMMFFQHLVQGIEESKREKNENFEDEQRRMWF